MRTVHIPSMAIKEIPPPTPLEQHLVGEQLQKLRQEKGLTLDDVFAATKVSRANLRAIESMSYEKLPADTFTRGLIILYASFLGVDGRRTADQFFTERDGGKRMGHSPQKCLTSPALTPKKLAEPAHVSSATIASILLLFIVLSFTGFCLYFSWNPFAFLTDKTMHLSSSVINTFHPADPATGNGVSHNALNLKARFLKDTRIRISLDNKEFVPQVYAKGTNAHWKAEKDIRLEFSEPDSAELQLNNKPLPFPQSVDGQHVLRIPAASSVP